MEKASLYESCKRKLKNSGSRMRCIWNIIKMLYQIKKGMRRSVNLLQKLDQRRTILSEESYLLAVRKMTF